MQCLGTDVTMWSSHPASALRRIRLDVGRCVIHLARKNFHFDELACNTQVLSVVASYLHEERFHFLTLLQGRGHESLGAPVISFLVLDELRVREPQMATLYSFFLTQATAVVDEFWQGEGSAGQRREQVFQPLPSFGLDHSP